MFLNIEQVRDEFGKLIKFAWPGGYPLYYVGTENEVLCKECADKDQDRVIAYDANYEDPDLYCDECNAQIGCAYCD